MSSAAFRAIAVVCGCATIGSCRTDPDQPAHIGVAPAEVPYVIVGSTAGAPFACTAAIIAARVSDLFRLISQGDGASAAALFGIGRPDVPFAWLSFTDKANLINFTVRESADTLAYRLTTLNVADVTLRGIDINGWVPSRESVGFLLFFEYMGVTSNSAERRFGFGKAEFHCPSATFLVMSLGRQDEPMWRALYEGHLGRPRQR